MKGLIEKMHACIMRNYEDCKPLKEYAKNCAAVATEHFMDKWIKVGDRLPFKEQNDARISYELYMMLPDGDVSQGNYDYLHGRFENDMGILIHPTHFIERIRPVPELPKH